MATHSIMATMTAKGNVQDAIYVHWDGNPETRLPILAVSYNDTKSVKALMALGNISSLQRQLSPVKGVPHDFDNSQENVTVAYHRERGDDLQMVLSKAGKKRIDYRGLIDIAHGYNAEYVYIWDMGKKEWKWWGIS